MNDDCYLSCKRVRMRINEEYIIDFFFPLRAESARKDLSLFHYGVNQDE